MRWNRKPAPPVHARRGIVGMVAFVLAFATAYAVPIKGSWATHEPSKMVKGTFPYHGFIWLDDLPDKLSNSLWVYSDRCKSAESSAWTRINSQLRGGQAEFRGAWPKGITFVAGGCRSTVDKYADIMLDYMTTSEWYNSGHGSYGGHHHASLGDSSWCAIWGARYPCGYHISRIHINEPRVAGYSSSYMVNFLMHETSHSMGFFDYCGHPSISNNGQLCSITGVWASGDKKVLRNVVYKNSPVYPFPR
jgi:hypothetical protein